MTEIEQLRAETEAKFKTAFAALDELAAANAVEAYYLAVAVVVATSVDLAKRAKHHQPITTVEQID